MKKTIPALALAVLAAGCSSTTLWPQTGAQYRQSVDSMPFGTVDSYTVNRSLASVNESLRAGALKCMNGSQSSENVIPGMPTIAPTTSNRVLVYSASVNTSPGRGELVLKSRYPGRRPIGYPKDGAVAYVVTTESDGAGTKVSTYYFTSGGYGAVNQGVKQWASSGALVCPRLPM